MDETDSSPVKPLNMSMPRPLSPRPGPSKDPLFIDPVGINLVSNKNDDGKRQRSNACSPTKQKDAKNKHWVISEVDSSRVIKLAHAVPDNDDFDSEDDDIEITDEIETFKHPITDDNDTNFVEAIPGSF